MQPTISGYLMQARQDDAARAGERDRLLVEARRQRAIVRGPAKDGGSARRLLRLAAIARTRLTAARAQVDTRVNGF